MFEKLEQAEKKFTALNESLADPAVLGDIDKMNAALKEIKHMTPVVEKYREYKKLLVEMDGFGHGHDGFRLTYKRTFGNREISDHRGVRHRKSA